jgi:hypothetical protein
MLIFLDNTSAVPSQVTRKQGLGTPRFPFSFPTIPIFSTYRGSPVPPVPPDSPDSLVPRFPCFELCRVPRFPFFEFLSAFFLSGSFAFSAVQYVSRSWKNHWVCGEDALITLPPEVGLLPLCPCPFPMVYGCLIERVCVCICVFIWVCVYLCVYRCVYMCVYIGVCIYVSIYVPSYLGCCGCCGCLGE